MTAADGLDPIALRRFLDETGVEVVGELHVRLLSGGKSNLTFRVWHGSADWILRRPPLGDVPRGAHDVLREHRVMTALRGSGVPVPRTVAASDDPRHVGAPFYLMDRVEAEVLRTAEDLRALDATRRTRVSRDLVDVLGDLNTLDPAAVGLGDFGRPDGYLDRQLARWSRQYGEIAFRELPAVDRLLDDLGARAPAAQRASLVHGDYRLDNVMIGADDRVVAVLDWEMATLGDPLTDLATLLTFWDVADRPHNPITKGLMDVPGVISPADVVERYVARTGLGVDDLPWYLCFANVKLAVIMEQIHARHLAGRTRGEGFDDLGATVDRLLDAAQTSWGAVR